MTLCKSCIICNDPVPLTENEKIAMDYGKPVPTKICDNCKAAVLYIRNQLQKEGATENVKSV